MSVRLGICLLVFVAAVLIAPGICLDSFFVPKTAWIALAGGLLLLAWLSGLALRRARPPRLGIEWPLGGFLAAALLSILTTRDPLPLLFPFLGLLLHIGLLFTFADAWRGSGRAENPHPLDWALAGAVLTSVYVLFQSYGLDPLGWQGGVQDWRGRLTGTLGGPNFVAGYAAVILPWGVHRFLSAPARAAAVLFVCVALILACLTVTFSVGAWSGVIAAVLFAVAVTKASGRKPEGRTAEPSHRNVLVRIIMLCCISLFIGTFYLSDNPWNNAGRSLLREAMDSPRWRTGHAARLFIWNTTGLMVRDHPALGIGFGNYFRIHQVYQGRLYELRGLPHDRPVVSNVPQVHNEYYQHLAETGIVGFLTLAWLAAAGVKAARGNWRRATPDLRPAFLAASAGLVAGSVHAFSSFPFRVPPTGLLLTLLAAFILAPPEAVPHFTPTGGMRRRGILLVAGAALVLGAIYAGTAPAVADASLVSAAEIGGRAGLERAVRAARVFPFSHRLRHEVARLLAAQGMYAEALRESEAALRCREAFETRKLRRDCLMALGNWAGAAGEGERMLRLNPAYPPLILEQAELARKAGRPVGAYLDRAESYLLPLLREGKRQEAMRIAQGIAALDPARRDRLRGIMSGTP